MRPNTQQLLQDLESQSEHIGELSTKNIMLKRANRIIVLLATLTAISFSAISLYQTKNYEASMSVMRQELDERAKYREEAILVSNEINELRSNVSLIQVSADIMKNDLKVGYPDLSHRVKEVIVQTIIEEAHEYNINPLVLYAMCYVESSFRPWLEHETRIIEVNNKNIKARAVGLMGIMWELHREKLKAAGIAESKSDLFDAATNIKAGAFLLNEFYQLDALKGSQYKDESALLRYFGGNYPVYVQRIEAKITQLLRPSLYRKD
jgi:soluble lytic murein transglycosylase-like protein